MPRKKAEQESGEKDLEPTRSPKDSDLKSIKLPDASPVKGQTMLITPKRHL
jgi:hypothetical protein